MTEREFLEAYVLAAARGAGRADLNVKGAVREAREAYMLIQEVTKEGGDVSVLARR